MSGKHSHGVLSLGIPNILSIFRLILIPVFITLYFSDMRYSGVISAGVLILSGMTDVFDGLIARKFNMASRLGKVLDPLADKLTQASVCICLVIKNIAPIWILCILILKEFVMIGVGANIIRKGKEMMSSKWFGKLGTVVFYTAMILIIAVKPPRHIAVLLIVVVLICMIFSLIMYIPHFLRFLKNENK